MTSAERAEYAREVIRAVYGAEPEDLMLSNAEVTEVMDWTHRDEPIPLRIVLQAISEMETHPSIRYVRTAVEREWERVQYARRIG